MVFEALKLMDPEGVYGLIFKDPFEEVVGEGAVTGCY